MNALRCVSLLLVAAVTWGCAEKKDNFMATAQGLQARTLYGPAETEYRRALKEDPTNAEAHYRLGALADRLGNTVGAEKEYRAALGANAQHAAARTALADILVKRGVGARRDGELD
ncbi:MAG: tetratricopeptide repeat protein, partial [Desulfurellaceae bacterium]|nr:tetratricopeptide repeat protein [Desulfurellaceae bacterium]